MLERTEWLTNQWAPAMKKFQGREEGRDEVIEDAEQFYTSYALTVRGREEIERYETAYKAIQDTLEIWPEDDEGDVVIEDNNGQGLAYFARSNKDPRIVHVYFMGPDMKRVDRIESYRCEYTPALGGSVRTEIKRLD